MIFQLNVFNFFLNKILEKLAWTRVKKLVNWVSVTQSSILWGGRETSQVGKQWCWVRVLVHLAGAEAGSSAKWTQGCWFDRFQVTLGNWCDVSVPHLLNENHFSSSCMYQTQSCYEEQMMYNGVNLVIFKDRYKDFPRDLMGTGNVKWISFQILISICNPPESISLRKWQVLC